MTPSRPGPAWWLVVVGCGIGLAVLMTASVRTGGFLVAASFAVGALLRAALPTSMTSGLAIRSRLTDVCFYLAAAVALAVIFAEVSLQAAYGT